MASSHPVLVYWSVEKQKRLPTSGQYVTVARFSQDLASWPAEAWSVVLKIGGDVRSQPCEADARFLSPLAPDSRFESGAIFELLEGNQVTATVHVL